MMRALDLFSAAAGGWTLGLHRAGFVTVAACEIVPWRRILYAENNPDVRLYEDVHSLTAARLVSDLGYLPDIVVGSPPCQDISVANTKGRGIDGERSRLYLEAVRLVGDCRPRWFAFENSAHLRTRGADRLLDALAALGYACGPCVVGAKDLGANHERKRSWLVGFDPDQLVDRAAGDAAASDADRGGRGDVLSQLQGHASRHAGMLPTPVKPNGGRRMSRQEIETGKRSNGAKAQIDTPNLLLHSADMLPTPTKRDRRMDAWSPAYDRRKSPTMDAVLDGAMTGRAPDRWTYARQIATLLKEHGLTGASRTLPVTYGWMMGYPPGWLTRAWRSAMEAGRLPPA